MFCKILWHDLKDDIKKRVISLAICLGALLITIAMIPGIIRGGSNQTPFGVIYPVYLASSVGTIMMLISVLTRFHRSLFTSELYLTLTRPASRTSVLLSKFLAGSAWVVLASVLTSATMAIISIYSPVSNDLLSSFMDTEVYKSLLDNPGTFVPLLAIFTVAAAVMDVAVAMFALTFGALIPRRSKMLIGIAIYFGASLVSTTISDFATSFVAMSMGEVTSTEIVIPPSLIPTYHISALIISSIVSIAVSIALFIVIRLIYNKKLHTVLN